MKIVLDTNVLMSGIFFGGPPGAILRAWRHGRLQLVLSPEILEEYQRVADELASHYQGTNPRPLLDLLVVHAEIVSGHPLSETVCHDPDDDKFLACAVDGKVNCIVSGDKHLLKQSGYREIVVLSPRAFLDQHLSQ